MADQQDQAKEGQMRKFVLLLVVGVFGCGGGPAAPTAPQPVQAAGVWRGTFRVTGGTGEPCVGAALQSAAGISFDYTLTVRQSGESLTATSTSVATGITCQLTGSAGDSSIVLNLTACNAPQPAFFVCGAGNIFREARPSALTLNLEVGGNSAAGSYIETYDVFVSGTSTNLGTASQTAQLTLNRQ